MQPVNLTPTNYIGNAAHVGVAQNQMRQGINDATAQEVHRKGLDAGQQTGELGRKGMEQESHGPDQTASTFVPTETESAEFQDMQHLRNMARGASEQAEGPETAGETASTKAASTPPPLPGQDQVKGQPDINFQQEEWKEFKALSDQNKNMLNDVFSGRLPLDQVPQIPLDTAEARLEHLADYTRTDQSNNSEIPFLKKWGMSSSRKMMQNYDRWADGLTEKMAKENPGVDKEKLRLYNLSQVILNDKDPASGKPRMEHMAASAHQYAKAYEARAQEHEMDRNPSVRVGKELDGMLSKLSPQEMKAVMATEEDLKDRAMKMAAQGRPLSPEDIQTIRASNLIDLGYTGAVNPDVAGKAREFLMSKEGAPDMESPQDFTNPNMFTGGINMPGMANTPGMPQIPGIPNYPGMPQIPGMSQMPGGCPPDATVQGQGQQGQVSPEQWNNFVGVLKAGERMSRIKSSAIMMLVGGPAMLPWAALQWAMPSSIDQMAAVYNPNAVPIPNSGGVPNAQAASFTGAPSYVPGNRGPVKSPLIFEDDEKSRKAEAAKRQPVDVDDPDNEEGQN